MARRRRRKKPKPLLFIVTCFVLVAAAVLAVGAVFNGIRCVEKITYPLEYGEIVEKAAEEYDLDEELIYAVIKTESGFDSDAVSSSGAIGLMQLMPSTFEWLQNVRGEERGDIELYEPEVNIDYGCYMLRYLLDMFEDEETAVAAYNAGFGAVGEWLENPECSDDGKTLNSFPDGYSETEEYVKKVEKAKEKYKKLYFD